MKILLIPTIREIYKNQFEYSVDIRLINFFTKIFKNSEVDIYHSSIKKNYDLVVLAGGNSSITKNGADKIRYKLNNLIFNFFLKRKIKIIGICHGAQFIAKKYGFKLRKKLNHTELHKVNFTIQNSKFKLIVNSFHNETIQYKNSNMINIFGLAEDNTVEAYHIENKKILGIMWHPERFTRIRSFDKKLIKEFYATNSIMCR